MAGTSFPNFGRIRAAIAAAVLSGAVLLTGQGASAGGAHHLLEALEPPREVAPRAGTMTGAFELVVLVDRGRLVAFLDNAVTNRPVVGATIELDVADSQHLLEEAAPGIYTTTGWLPGPGVSSLMFSVIAGDVDDLLIVDFKLDDAAAAPLQAAAGDAGIDPWTLLTGDTGRVVTALLVAGGTTIALLAGILLVPVLMAGMAT